MADPSRGAFILRERWESSLASNDLTVCPRCSAPVRGQFRYCPECACRLPGFSAPPQTAPRPRYWVATLVGLGLAGITGLILMTGLGLFRTQARETMPTPATIPPPAAPAVAPLRIADLNEAFAPVSGGLAFFVPDVAPNSFDPEVRVRAALREAPSDAPALSRLTGAVFGSSVRAAPVGVTTDSFLLMRYEVTRGQWAEFLGEAERAVVRLERTSWIRELWAPRNDRERAASDRYVTAWLEAASRTLSGDELAKARSVLQRPLTSAARMLLLSPPSWIVLADDGELDWRMPAGTNNFPVSGISAIDAEIFVIWARPAVRLVDLRLPTIAELRRAFHNGNPPMLSGTPGAWPWGDAWRPLGFNNRRYQRQTGQSGPIDVFGPNALGTRQREGAIHGLAGNVAEWVRPITLVPRGNRLAATEARVSDRRTMQVAGGSFLDEPEACRSILWPAYQREQRLEHVGFRLALTESSMFGGR